MAFNWRKNGIKKGVKATDGDGNTVTIVSFGPEGFVEVRDSKGKRRSVFGGTLTAQSSGTAYTASDRKSDSGGKRKWKIGIPGGG